MLSAIIISAIIVVICIVTYAKKRAAYKKDVAKGEDYHVPLSDDVQHIYYDQYEKEMARQKAAAEEEKNTQEQLAKDEVEIAKNRELHKTEDQPENPNQN